MTDLTPVDRDAFERAIAIYRRERYGGDEHISSKIREEGFEAAGRFCAYWCQSKNLKLEPQQFPPAWLHDINDTQGPEFKGKVAAAQLLRRLLAAGLSQYEPSPLAALGDAGKKLAG